MNFTTLEVVARQSSALSKGNEWSESVLSELKDLLNGNKLKQSSGACLLHVVLEKCDSDVFEECATTWIRSMLQIANTIPSENLLNLCFDNLRQILERSVRFDKLYREIATKGIDPLLSLLVGSFMLPLPTTFKLIESCLSSYGSPCGRFRSGFEKLLLTGVEDDDHRISSEACRCFPALALCGTGGEKRQKQIDNWQLLFKRVLKSAYSYLNLFTNEMTGNDNENKNDNNEIAILEFVRPVYNDISKISNRIMTLISIIKEFLSRSYPFVVNIPINLLMHLLCDISNIPHLQFKVLYKLNNKVKMVISKLTDNLLQCLCVCIRQLSSLFLPFLPIVSKILVAAASNPELNARIEIYTCVFHIVDQWKALPKNVSLLDEMIKHILSDIKITGENDKIIAVETGERGGKKKKKLSQKLSQDIANKNKVPSTHQFKTEDATMALKLLEKIVLICGPLLPMNGLKSIIACVLKTTFKMLSTEELQQAPYNTQENAVLLFKVVYSIVNLYHHSLPVPTNILLSLFRKGAKHRNQAISSYCQDCLFVCDRFLYGSHPCLRDYSTYVSETSDVQEKEIHAPNNPPPCNMSSTIMKSSYEQSYTALNSFRQGSMVVAAIEQQTNPAEINLAKSGSFTQHRTKLSAETSPMASHSAQRQCKSADHVAKENTIVDLPRKPSSEPAVSHTSVVESLDDVVESFDDVVEVEEKVGEYRYGRRGKNHAVVISSEDEDESRLDSNIRKRVRKEHSTTRNSSGSLISKRQKVTPSNQNNNDEIEIQDGAEVVDNEVDAILQTFCEVDAD